MNVRQWNRGTIFFGIGTVILLIIGLIAGGAALTKPVKKTTAVGNQQNTDPVYSAVTDWPDLVKTVNTRKDQWYRDCLAKRVGVSWAQATEYASIVKRGTDLRFILISNSSISDEEARKRLKEQGVPSVNALHVRRVNGFRNTRGLTNDKCNAFGDSRSQVRISLAIPVDVNDLRKGVLKDKGVLANCGNPWDIPRKPSKPSQPVPTGPTNPPTDNPPTKPPLTPKDPSKDVNVNPDVPEEVRGPGTTPVGTDPGPATPVYDTPTGCNGPCPGPTPTPVATDRPPGDPNGGSGDGGATPGPGPTDDSDAGQTTSPAPSSSASSGPVCGTGNPDDC